MGNEAVGPLEIRDLERELESLHPASFGWALACCRWNRDEAEDVLQTAYLKALDGRAHFNGHSCTKSWFFGVVKKTALEKRRFRIVREMALARWLRRAPQDGAAPTPERLSSEAQAERRLRDMLERLSPRQRELLHLVFYQELTIEEAAAVLHLSLGSARTHYERGKARLRGLLAEAGEGR